MVNGSQNVPNFTQEWGGGEIRVIGTKYFREDMLRMVGGGGGGGDGVIVVHGA